jgi:hypothetical protein
MVPAIADVPPPAAAAAGAAAISVGLAGVAHAVAGVAQADATTRNQTTGARRKDQDIPEDCASNAPWASGVIHTEIRSCEAEPFPA